MANVKTVFAKATSKIGKLADKHGPNALVGIGIACGIGAVAVSFNAKEKIKAELEAREIAGEETTKKQRILIFAKHTWPIAAFGACGATCVIASNRILTGKNAALAATCGILGREIIDKDEALVKAIGEEKSDKIETDIAKKRVEAAMDDGISPDKIIVTGQGDDLCYDTVSGRWFYSNKTSIRNAALSVNEKINNELFAFLNDLYDELNLPNIAAGDMLGWSLQADTIREGKLYIHYDSGLTKDGKPYLAMKYKVAPCYDGDDYYYGGRR